MCASGGSEPKETRPWMRLLTECRLLWKNYSKGRQRQSFCAVIRAVAAAAAKSSGKVFCKNYFIFHCASLLGASLCIDWSGRGRRTLAAGCCYVMGNVTVEFKKRENCRQNNKVLFFSLAFIFPLVTTSLLRRLTLFVLYLVGKGVTSIPITKRHLSSLSALTKRKYAKKKRNNFFIFDWSMRQLSLYSHRYGLVGSQ